MNSEQNPSEKLEAQTVAAAKALTGMVGKMVDDGVEPAALVEALATVLGSVMGAAPRDMADRLDASIMGKVRKARAKVWAALDAVPVH
jgi:hypothetical protein